MGAWTRASKLSSGSIGALGSNLFWTRLINIKKRSLVVVGRETSSDEVGKLDRVIHTAQ
jgi:hypothetical protein